MQTFDSASSTNCYRPVASGLNGYSLSDYLETSTGFTALLSLSGTPNNVYGPDISNLKLEVVYHTSEIIQVKITDAKQARWEIPSTLIARHQADPSAKKLLQSSPTFTVKYTENPFTLQVIRTSDNEVVFDLDALIIYQDQYIEFSVLSNNQQRSTFGFGESTRTKQSLDLNHIYTLWAADIGAQTMYQNLYGSYPMYVQQVTDSSKGNIGSAHGGVLMNSNGMDISILPDRINYKILGGVIDYYVLVGGANPKDVVAQASTVIGKPSMVPYWSLGFHNCRYGYKNIQQVEEIVANYSAAGIPLDTQWVDIDYMEAFRDFTVSSQNFPASEVQSFVNKLHANGQHFVPIVDPGIMTYAGYDAYEKGLKYDIFIKDLQGNNYLGQVWPGPVYFPDFFHPKAQDYWTEQFTNFYSLVEIDGVWIDMNEIANFCNQDGDAQVCSLGDSTDCGTTCCLKCSQVDSAHPLDYPKYHINNRQGKLAGKTVAMSNQQYGNLSAYDTHNLYGLTEQIASKNAMKQIRNKRPFVLSRSSFLSSGLHTAKWSGDNYASWDDLKASIVSILDFNIFSVPMIGADICGFGGNTNEELCARWIEVGAFYPFSRDHNAIDSIDQELYLWSSVSEAAKKALAKRYQLLPYFYSLMYNAHTNGQPVIQSLWMNFPIDSNTHAIDNQFMVGPAILVSPVLQSGATSVNAYFPAGLWYDFNTKKLAIDSTSGGKWVELDAPLTEVQTHIKGGSIVALQESAMTTTAGRNTPFTLVVALCPKNGAKGGLFWDDGEQIEITNYLNVKLQASIDSRGKGKLTSQVITDTYADAKNSIVGRVVVTGKGLTAPKQVVINGLVLSSSSWSFDAANQILTISRQGSVAALNDSFKIEW
eukprot:CAMPEP_0173147580 /NCGR_PEP_ID=MMETSP1105-20130129/9218_1 /TAXON_ID=2985 /ORGANISM="Ochromonas sp., Strain BG-1" /LENGTH=872 /DNA_ID=CAMNT_0014062089 /DNA_START=184 /DNA_END=2799 /DNA_ORIENTATION=+